jgi:hypothetical protein
VIILVAFITTAMVIITVHITSPIIALIISMVVIVPVIMASIFPGTAHHGDHHDHYAFHGNAQESGGTDQVNNDMDQGNIHDYQHEHGH